MDCAPSRPPSESSRRWRSRSWINSLHVAPTDAVRRPIDITNGNPGARLKHFAIADQSGMAVDKNPRLTLAVMRPAGSIAREAGEQEFLRRIFHVGDEPLLAH